MAGPAWLTGPHTPPPRRGDMAKAARSYRSRELRGRTYASCAAAGPGRDRVWSVARLPQSAVPQRTAPSPRRARARARGAEPACMAEPPRSWLLWLARFAARAQLVCLLSRALSLSCGARLARSRLVGRGPRGGRGHLSASHAGRAPPITLPFARPSPTESHDPVVPSRPPPPRPPGRPEKPPDPTRHPPRRNLAVHLPCSSIGPPSVRLETPRLGAARARPHHDAGDPLARRHAAWRHSWAGGLRTRRETDWWIQESGGHWHGSRVTSSSPRRACGAGAGAAGTRAPANPSR
jgi:hypothetical protein